MIRKPFGSKAPGTKYSLYIYSDLPDLSISIDCSSQQNDPIVFLNMSSTSELHSASSSFCTGWPQIMPYTLNSL